MKNKHYQQLCETIFLEAIMILSGEGFVNPAFFMIKDNESVFLPGLNVSQLGKDAVEEIVHNFAKETNADGLIFIGESLYTTDKEFYGKPQEDPESIAVLTLVCLTANGEDKGIISGDIKNTLGGVPYVKHWEWADHVDELPFFKKWK